MHRSIQLIAQVAILATVGQILPVGFSMSAVQAASFSCSHQLLRGRAYTLQTVTGTLNGNVPSDVTVWNYQDIPQVAATLPPRDTSFWAAYFESAYKLLGWYLGTTPNKYYTYHFFTPVAPGTSFTALLITEFQGGSAGNWQNWMPCTTTP